MVYWDYCLQNKKAIWDASLDIFIQHSLSPVFHQLFLSTSTFLQLFLLRWVWISGLFSLSYSHALRTHRRVSYNVTWLLVVMRGQTNLYNMTFYWDESFFIFFVCPMSTLTWALNISRGHPRSSDTNLNAPLFPSERLWSPRSDLKLNI